MAYEQETFEAIQARIQARVSQGLDKRASAPDWNASAPAAVEMAILYTALDFILEATFADTAPRTYLIRRGAERGVIPFPATKAVYRGEFNQPVPIGARFSLEKLNYVVTEPLPEGDTPTCFAYRVACETPGAIGNTQLGGLIPIQYLDGLTRATLAELLIPGAEEEETEAFRRRYLASLNSQAFGGNQADYREKVLALPGIGAVKVFPVWNAGIDPTSLVPSPEVTAWYTAALETLPEQVAAWLTPVYTAADRLLLTVGGTVRLVILDTAYGVPSPALVADVQAAIDPPTGRGEGLGLAPIGHVVRVDGAESVPMDVAFQLTYQPGWDWASVESYVQDTLDDYFLTLAKAWQAAETTVVRISQLETRVLTCPGILDVTATTICGNPDNVTLTGTQLPVRGEVRG